MRQKGGEKAAKVAIIANCILTVLNIIIGTLCGSYALVSEGAHTLSDVATSVIAYIGFKIGQKPADEEHPLGHGRAEAISGLVIVLSLSTCGIYHYYWLYKQGDTIDNIKVQRGRATGSLGILYLILGIFGITIVSYALMQNELNTFAKEQI